MYQIIEQYDGSGWRLLASGRSRESAEMQLRRDAEIRSRGGYGFFAVRRVKGTCRYGAPISNSRAMTLPTWDSND